MYLRYYRILSYICLTAILLWITAFSPESCRAEALAEDSLRFAHYWELWETGDSVAARSYLLNLGAEGNSRIEQMAGFLLAWQSFQRGDYIGVPVQLDLGIPEELSDHALYLRAQALRNADQPGLSEPFWIKLAKDTTSVYSQDALYELSLLSKESNDLEAYLDYAERYREQPSSIENRQQLDHHAAEILAAVGDHAQAVEILYRAWLAGPATADAEQIRGLIAGYYRRHQFSPRTETREEVETELASLERTRNFRIGLNRVRQIMQTTEGAGWGDLLGYYKGRFESGLGRHREAIGTLDNYLRRYPQSRFLYSTYFHMGRSAYLTDQDTLAISTLLQAADQSDDLDLAGRALELLGILYLDRGRPADAENVFRRWETLGRGSSTETDCLWRLGWALWETQQYREAANTWNQLFERDSLGGYAPGAVYWSARGAAKAGQNETATKRLVLLSRRFPFSYYSVIAGSADPQPPINHPLMVPSLDEIWSRGGLHARRFCLLAALRLPDLALREWRAAQCEFPPQKEFAWWEAQLHLWQGDRVGAVRIIRSELSDYIRSAGDRPAGFMSAVYPLDFDPQIIRMSREYRVDPYFIFALICQESHYDPNAQSGAGAIGLMQLMPATARKEAGKLGISYAQRKLRDPDYNIRLGVSHISGLLTEFNGDSVLALCAYNAGKQITESWMMEFGQRARDEFVELIPYRETRLFVKRNIEHKAAYRRLYPDAVPSVSTAATPSEIKQ
ncbi:MAG: transglycosylase SLT domain-containing protein, partial [Calditrichota bacterium]